MPCLIRLHSFALSFVAVWRQADRERAQQEAVQRRGAIAYGDGPTRAAPAPKPDFRPATRVQALPMPAAQEYRVPLPGTSLPSLDSAVDDLLDLVGAVSEEP